MLFSKVKEIFEKLVEERCAVRAVSFSGGGEPLLHPQIKEILEYLRGYGIKLGVATNGVGLDKLPEGVLDNFEWIRISTDSIRNEIPLKPETRARVSYSWVYRQGDENNECFVDLILAARMGEIDHFRVGEDIYNLQPPGYSILPWRMNHGKGIAFQDRTIFTKGAKECWVSLLRPLISVEGHFYPCCGVHYARGFNHGESYPEGMDLGTVDEYLERVRSQVPFDGSGCKKCYFGSINDMLGVVKHRQDLKDLEFV
jgi:hypothetical protein